uniref:L-type lectin-like domain-containing protein n=1 Tax=Capra hircus TaxID=9925 RepID=A0A8C2NIX5_CAPHI
MPLKPFQLSQSQMEATSCCHQRRAGSQLLCVWFSSHHWGLTDPQFLPASALQHFHQVLLQELSPPVPSLYPYWKQVCRCFLPRKPPPALLAGKSLSVPHFYLGAPGSHICGPELACKQPCFLKDWEMHVHFKVHGAGKKNLHGDGIALWYTRDRLVPGPVFGSKDNFHGLAIFLDTYPNDETTERVFPYISVMVNNGSLSYDHSKDGRWTELAGCTADFRNRDHDTFLAVRYSRGRLTVMTDLEDKNEWKNCIDITGVRLPTGYYFGASAGTGDLSDNHDIISMKLFQLMVEHTPDEESIDWTKIEPSVSFLKSPKDNVDDPTGNFRSGPLTGWRVFLLLLCALLGIIVCAVVGAVVFQKRQERNKRFY